MKKFLSIFLLACAVLSSGCAQSKEKAMEAKNRTAIDDMNEVFRESLPYFEKAHELKPDNTNYMQTLKMLYYRFRTEPGMQEKYDAIEAKLNN